MGDDAGWVKKAHEAEAKLNAEREALAARKERQRLAWIRFMCAVTGLAHGDSEKASLLGKSADALLHEYNERWEQDD